MQKICLYCQTSQPLSNFAPHPSGRFGVHPWCQGCVRAYSRARYHGKAPPPRAQRSATTRENTQPHGAVHAQAEHLKYRKSGHAPPWTTVEDTEGFYIAAARAPGRFVVDHVIPVKGKNVCGLHVAWNLQLLTYGENLRKRKQYHEPW